MRKVHVTQQAKLHAYACLDKQNQKTKELLLADLPPVPAGLIKILLSKKKKINWKHEEDAMELCLSLFLGVRQHHQVLSFHIHLH